MEQALFQRGFAEAERLDPGLTSPITGTYNAKTRAFVLTWTSQVVGGPFNGFTGCGICRARSPRPNDSWSGGHPCSFFACGLDYSSRGTE